MAIIQIDCHCFDCVCECTLWYCACNHRHFAISQTCLRANIEIDRRYYENCRSVLNSMDFNLNTLMKMKTENLVYVANLGNGIFICDKTRRQYGYHVAVAHIDYHRKVKYYDDLPCKTKVEIENFATSGNMATSEDNPNKYALRPIN